MKKQKKYKLLKLIMYIVIGFIVLISTSAFFILNQPEFGKLPANERLERIKKSPNYKDGAFKNQSITPNLTGNSGFLKALYDFLFKSHERVTPESQIPSIKTDIKNLKAVDDVLIWFGHSSYFIQIDGKKILVDPVFNDHASPFPWMVKAFKGSNPFKAEDIPNIDYLIITHDHWDHLDYNTLQKLKGRIKKVVCGLGVGEHLEYWGFNPKIITELDWYEQTTLDSGFTLNATPARHFSNRGLKRNQTLWVSYVLQTPTMNLFLGGDGGYDKHFAEIGEKFGPFDLAILEQGQYNEKWKYIHLLPNQVLNAAKELKAKRIFPVHNSKFALSTHPWDEPLEQIINNNETVQMPIITPMIGEKVILKDTTQVFSQWWKGLR